MKTAFLFPGQGSQYVGMGQAFYAEYPQARAIFDQADAAMGGQISRMCFEGPEETLVETVHQQPTIHTTEVAMLRVVESLGLRPDVVAGFSLGEYAALVCAGTLDFADSLALVTQRGQLIQDCVPQGVGGMASISGLDRNRVEELVADLAPRVICSNYNCPGQTVISGYQTQVDVVMDRARAAGGRVVELKVSAPFHTSLLAPAGVQLGQSLSQVTIAPPQMAYIPNLTGKAYQTGNIGEILAQHVSSPVYWEDSVYTMLEMGVELFVEIGPKNVVSKNTQRTIKATGKTAKVINVEKPKDLEKLLAAVGR